MPTQELISIKKLKLDLKNFRTVEQQNETNAIRAIISINPDYFWGLMESLVDDGYLPTENVIVIKASASKQSMIVREGNRRVGALKLIFGFLPTDDIRIPSNLSKKIDELTTNWKKANEKVPCTIYESKDAAIVDRIITLTHGKGEKAGRSKWPAVATARHKRDVNGASEPGLDLLEKYLDNGGNVTPRHAEQWSGDYPLTVLDDMVQRYSMQFGAKNSAELANQYPSVQHRDALENILHDIGLGIIKFETIRKKKDEFLNRYGLPLPIPAAPSGTSETSSAVPTAGATSNAPSTSPSSTNTPPTGTGSAMSSSAPSAAVSSSGATASASTSGKKVAAVPINDPRSVVRMLRSLKPLGNNRQKIVTLKNEALELDLQKTPFAFCFLLRSMFEISAKAYCDDHKASGGPLATKADAGLLQSQSVAWPIACQASDKWEL